jgi:hypothetical protein
MRLGAMKVRPQLESHCTWFGACVFQSPYVHVLSILLSVSCTIVCPQGSRKTATENLLPDLHPIALVAEAAVEH